MNPELRDRWPPFICKPGCSFVAGVVIFLSGQVIMRFEKAVGEITGEKRSLPVLKAMILKIHLRQEGLVFLEWLGDRGNWWLRLLPSRVWPQVLPTRECWFQAGMCLK